MVGLVEKTWFGALVLLAFGACACSASASREPAVAAGQAGACPAEVPAPHLLPGAKPEHRSPGFWIDRLSAPDRPVLSTAEIEEHNRHAETRWRDNDFGFRRDLLSAAIDSAVVLRQIERDVEAVREAAASGARVLLDGTPWPDPLFDEMRQTLSTGQPAGELRVAFRLVPLRSLPTERGMYEQAGDVDFDLMHCCSLRPGELVRVVATHRSGWLLVRSEYAYGFTRGAGLSAPLDEQEAAAFREASEFVVVTADRAPLWSAAGPQQQLAAVRIGQRLPLRSTDDAAAADLVPVLAPAPSGFVAAHVAATDVHVGYLPMSRRNVVRHAFEQLDDAFGWGGMGGDRDCSRFLMDLFALFGLQLPRNSKFQAQSGSWTVPLDGLTSAQKVAELDRAAAHGLVLMYMKGHIMLLLGKDEARPFAIHQFSGYRVPCPSGGDIKKVVSRTAVTDLRLGEGSQRRSFIERLSKLVVIGRKPGS